MAKKQNGGHSHTSSNKPIRILLADDHRIVRSGLRRLLEQERSLAVVGEADDGRTAIDLAKKLSPDVILMDISMNDMNGVEATRRISATNPKSKVLILSVHAGQKLVSEVFKAGASGYVLKDCDFSEVFAAIRAVAADETYICPQIATLLRNDYVQRMTQDGASSALGLTPREREVLQLMAEGKSTKEIAFAFDVSIKTVEVHRQRIMEKLDLHTIAELTKYAIREGLTSLER
jgi:DNA-binding NarL/FixJ family response regulator